MRDFRICYIGSGWETDNPSRTFPVHGSQERTEKSSYLRRSSNNTSSRQRIVMAASSPNSRVSLSCPIMKSYNSPAVSSFFSTRLRCSGSCRATGHDRKQPHSANVNGHRVYANIEHLLHAQVVMHGLSLKPVGYSKYQALLGLVEAEVRARSPLIIEPSIPEL